MSKSTTDGAFARALPRGRLKRLHALSIGTMALIAFGLLFAAIAAVWREADALSGLSRNIKSRQDVVATLSRVREQLLIANLRERGYVITGLEQDAGDYRRVLAEIDSGLRSLSGQVDLAADGRTDLNGAVTAVQRTLAHYASVIGVRQTGGEAAAEAVVRTGAGEALQAEALDRLRRASARQGSALGLDVVEQRREARTVITGAAAMTLIAATLFAGMAALTWRYFAAQALALQLSAENEGKYRLLFEANPEAMWVHDDAFRMLAVNQTAVNRYQYSREEFLSNTPADLGLTEELPVLQRFANKREQERAAASLVRHARKDGTTIEAEISSDTIVWNGRPARLVVAKDVTERRRLEDQFRQAQKMEGVGRLAAGVAHDFNNLLTVISGYTDLLLSTVGETDERHGDLAEIRDASTRGAALTRQLLAFSRKQVIAPEVLDVNDVVRSLANLLRRMVGEDVELTTVLGEEAGRVLADRGQLEQVLVNLAVNARDAMPTGGTLSIETFQVHVSRERGEHPLLAEGQYVVIAVTDTGTGMDAEVKAHVFEPFFTTKDKDRGTGLGLATVYGIVTQYGGHIDVDSEPGHGASFKIYLPRVEGPSSTATAPAAATLAPALEGRTVLIVEDDSAVRAAARQLLEREGCAVLGAADAESALALAARHPGTIDLLLTDVILPGQSGSALAERFASLRPAAAILYMSGYTDDEIVRRGVLRGEVKFLQKPFSAPGLIRAVAGALAGL